MECMLKQLKKIQMKLKLGWRSAGCESHGSGQIKLPRGETNWGRLDTGSEALEDSHYWDRWWRHSGRGQQHKQRPRGRKEHRVRKGQWRRWARALERARWWGWRGALGTRWDGLFLHRVQFLMLNKTAIPFEGFPTHLTFVRLLSGVNSLMLNGGDLLRERLATLLTLEGLLPSMNSLMDNEKWPATKGFPAFLALIEFLPSV